MTASAPIRSAVGHGSLCSLPLPFSLPADRRARLRNGARPGDFLAAPRCGAHTRAGACCRQPAMRNGRCRLHGGLSTGPRTAEGRARCARARLKHGFYSAATRALLAEGRAQLRRMRTTLSTRRSAGHGVLRQDPRSPVGAPPCGCSNTGTMGRPRWAATTTPVIRVHLCPPAFAKPAPAGEGRSAAGIPATAGHGVLRSKSPSRPSPRAAHLLAGTALRTPLSAGHGVLPSFSPAGPVPAGMVGQSAPQFVAAGVRW